MADLEARLQRGGGRAADRLVATDGVFSMDGYIAQLDEICELAERYGALVMVDDSPRGRLRRPDAAAARPSCHGVVGRVDIVTGTLGKALGGASGGYVSGRAEIVELLRQRSRPYLFSNTLRAADRRRLARGARPARHAATSCATACAPTPRCSARG